jgi:hypothetical protein
MEDLVGIAEEMKGEGTAAVGIKEIKGHKTLRA